jgi:hypothetical protein
MTIHPRPSKRAFWLHGLAFLALPQFGCTIIRHEPAKTPTQVEAAPTPEKPKPKPKPKPVAEKPAKPVVEKPAKPVVEKPAKPVVEKPAKPVIEKPAKPGDEKPAKPVAEKPATDTEQPSSGGEKPATGKPEGGTGGSAPLPTDKTDELSHLVVPLRVPFAELVAKIDALVPKTDEQKEWTRVSKPGDSPEVDITYKIWRDRISAKLADGTLTVTVPLHYAAHFRAKIQNPLQKSDSIWLTKDDTWGTTADPQHLTVTVTLKPKVEPTWTIESNMRLEPLVHGPAPKGDACVKVGIKACVSRKSLAPSIREHLEDALTPKLKSALKNVDAELNTTLNLKAHAAQLWSALQKPQRVQESGQAKCPTQLGRACKEPAWVVAQPTAISLGALKLDGKDLRIDFGLTGKLAVVSGAAPSVTARALPKVASEDGKPEVALHVDLRAPSEWLKAVAEKALKAVHMSVTGKPALDLSGVSIRAERDAKNPRRVTITAKATGAVEGELALSGDFKYDATTHELALRNVSYDPGTAALLEALAPAERDRLKTLLEGKLKWDLTRPLGALDVALVRALGDTLKGELTLGGNLDSVSVHDFAMANDGLTLRLSLEGQLEAKYTPK